MKNAIILTYLFLSTLTFAQDVLPIFGDTTFEKNLLKISSHNYYSSNHFNNALLDKFIFGGTITDEIKNKNSERLSPNNRLGGEMEQTIEHYNANIHPIRNKKYGLLLSFSDAHLLSANVPTDLFNLAMYGNADYLNDTLKFGFAHVQYLHYQKIGVGIFDKSTLSSLKVNYIAGSKVLEGRLNDSWMLNQPDSITLKMQGAGYSSDRFYPYMGFQGSGVTVDLNYNFLFESRKGNSQFLNLKISNLGFVVWNANNHQYTVDSTSNYTGFDIRNFINQPEGTSKKYNFIDTLGIYEGQGKNIAAMPIEFVLQKAPVRNSSQKLQYILGFKTILTSDYFPYLFAGIYYAPVANFSASTRLSYGGFGGLQWGLNLNYWIKGKTYLALGTYDMIGNISKNYGFGRSINFSAHFNL